jgi:predicted permease
MFWRRRQRLDDEIRSHLEEEAADNIARGMDPGTARRAALRTFGNVGAVREKSRELDPLYWLDTLSQDFRFAFRLIARNRWISLTIVATLTVGIALNVTVFSLLNAVLMRAWVRTEPETFIRIIPQFSGKYDLRFSDSGSMSQPDYEHYREAARSLQSLAAYRFLPLTLSGSESGALRGALVSCNLFDVVRPGPPVAGRYFLSDECTTTMEPAVVVLGESFWRTRFDADPAIVGRVIQLNRIPFTIAGVAPRIALSGSNAGPLDEADAWVPYTMLSALRPADEYFANPRAQWLTIVGRRSRQYALPQVQQEMNLLARQADERVPGRRTSLIVTNGSLVQDPEMRARAPLIFGVTLGTTALLLILVCVNVTTLLLTRSAARQREIAVRLSMGAGRGRLLRQFLTESLVLSGLGAGVSLVIAERAPAALWNSLMSRPAPFDVRPDWRVLLYCLGLATIAGLMAGMSPAIEALRPDLSESLRGSSSAVTPGRPRSRLRSVLVAVQIAVSLLLVVQVCLLARAQRRFFSYDPGFETHRVLNVALASVAAGFAPGASFYRELEARVQAVPGVVSTSYVSIVPWSGRNSTEMTQIDGQPVPPTHDYRQDPARRVVSSDFFATVGIPITRGRAFTREDSTAGLEESTVISEAMASRYWPDQDPLGHSFGVKPVHRVIGVCRDVQSVTYMQEDGPFYYSLLDVAQSKPPSLLVRTSGASDAVAAAIRDIIRQTDPQMASTVTTLAALVDRQGENLRPVVVYGALAGMLALVLALVGVYGVVSFSISQRVREIGIRMALGARRTDVLVLVLRSAAAPVCAGLASGVGLALAASAVMKTVLFGTDPRDPVVLAGVTLLLLAAALGATWIPARRAAALDPLSSLHHE